jgi:hypothetical protein
MYGVSHDSLVQATLITHLQLPAGELLMDVEEPDGHGAHVRRQY